jgi:hypothetical protein
MSSPENCKVNHIHKIYFTIFRTWHILSPAVDIQCLQFMYSTLTRTMAVVQGLRLALSNGPNRLGFILSPNDESRASFQNVGCFSTNRGRKMSKNTHQFNDTPLSETFSLNLQFIFAPQSKRSHFTAIQNSETSCLSGFLVFGKHMEY